MAWHTVRETIALTGRSRRSLYRDIGTGRVSSDIGIDGQRRFETSELMRAYGPLAPVAQVDTPEVAQVGTPSSVPLDMAELVKELRELKEEVRELKQALRLIEHKPDIPAVSKGPKTVQGKPHEPVTWAGLLSTLDAD